MKALIYNSKVIQVATEEFPVHPSMSWAVCPSEVQPGWSCIEGEFIAPAAEAEPTIEHLRASAVLGPMELEERLSALGLFDTVNAWANAQGGRIAWAWNRATQFERNHPLIADAQVALGMTDAQVDELFGINP